FEIIVIHTRWSGSNAVARPAKAYRPSTALCSLVGPKLDVVLSASSDGGLEKSMPCLFVTGIRRSAAVATWPAAGVAALAFLWTPADAAEIRLLSAAAMQSVFKDIAAEFESASGHKLTITYATIGGVTERIQRGEAADFVIGSSITMPQLVNTG